MKKELFYTILIFSSLFTTDIYAQYPFSSYKNEDIYCFSKQDIQEQLIEKIHIVSQSYEKMEFNNHWELGIIQFGEHETSENRRRYTFATDTIIPLTTLFKVTNFVTGQYYQFERDKIVSAGTRAFGKLCRKGYYHREGYTIVENRCRFDERGDISIIYYQLPRAPQYKLVNPDRAIDLEGTPLDEVLNGLVFQDTVFYNYNKSGGVTSTYHTQTEDLKEHFMYKNSPISYDYASYYKHYQIYIDTSLELENYVKQQLGFLPKYLLFEIYGNAAFSFLFDEETQKYYQQATIDLE